MGTLHHTHLRHLGQRNALSHRVDEGHGLHIFDGGVEALRVFYLDIVGLTVDRHFSGIAALHIGIDHLGYLDRCEAFGLCHFRIHIHKKLGTGVIHRGGHGQYARLCIQHLADLAAGGAQARDIIGYDIQLFRRAARHHRLHTGGAGACRHLAQIGEVLQLAVPQVYHLQCRFRDILLFISGQCCARSIFGHGDIHALGQAGAADKIFQFPHGLVHLFEA